MAFSSEYKDRYATFLIKLAWSVEIVAVVIGLMISLVVSISASQAFMSGQEEAGFFGATSNMLVAGLPFLLVAIVELCKIPLTFTFMAVTNLKWRLIFMFFVFFLCSITFETMLNGFERNFSNLNFAIDTRKNQIENINAEIGLLEIRRDRIQTFTEDDLLAEVAAVQSDIDTNYSSNVRRTEANTKELLDQIDYSFKDKLNSDIDALMIRRDEYYEAWNAEREDIEARFSTILLGNISDSRGEKDRLVEELEALKRERRQRLASAGIFTRAGIEKRFNDLIAAKDRQIAEISTGFLGGDALTKQAVMEDQFKSQMAFMNEKYQGRINDINARIEAKKQEIIDKEQGNIALESSLRADAEKSRARYLTIKRDAEGELNIYRSGKEQELAAIAVQVEEIEDKVFMLRNDQRNIQANINMLISQNQVYRIAMYAYGKESPVEVERRMVGVVALLWFGSLALIASVTGVMLALAGFYLKRTLLEEAQKHA
ncbi:MAG: hypothetical protein RL336_545 [Pseudomonadota bacterium]